SRRTGLSFQRTRLSADRTLMSIIRTSLSLIGFGFTIFQFFHFLRKTTATAQQIVPLDSGRRFGTALVALGIGMLATGLWTHWQFMRQIRQERHEMVQQHLVHGALSFPLSMTWAVAFLLLCIGLIAIIGMTIRAGPFH